LAKGFVKGKLGSAGHSTTGVITIFLAALLFVATAIVGWIVVDRMHESQRWVLHTYEVRGQIRQARLTGLDLSSRLATALQMNDASYLQGVAEDLDRQRDSLFSLRELTKDNPVQQERLSEIEPLLAELHSKVGSCRTSLTCLPGPESARQDLLRVTWDRKEQMLAILEAMEREEDRLLNERLALWSGHFRLLIAVLVTSFVTAVILTFFNLRSLFNEAERRSRSEQLIREHVDSYRALSGRILELQDSERRKIARELHDSVGQYLAGVRLQLTQLERLCAGDSPNIKAHFSETMELVDRSLGEVRTISHLLHPPLLDELGLYSAARWYVEGFAKRSDIEASFTVDDFSGRLHKDSELALFRVLQEALTNVHRHSNARRVRVDLSCKNGVATVQVTDNGHGIPPGLLRRFRDGHGGGIGLAGMRERLADLRGRLYVESDSSGTTIRATVPVDSCLSPQNPRNSEYA